MTDTPPDRDPADPGWAAPGGPSAPAAPGGSAEPALPPPPPGAGGAPQQFGYGFGYASAPKNSGLAIAALVCGIVGVLVLNVILGPLAFVFGLVARNQINQSDGRQKGMGMAVAGIVLGPIDLILGILVINATL